MNDKNSPNLLETLPKKFEITNEMRIAESRYEKRLAKRIEKSSGKFMSNVSS
jgi:hypothetical protein